MPKQNEESSWNVTIFDLVHKCGASSVIQAQVAHNSQDPETF